MRRQVTLTLDDRGNAKEFVLTEMSAYDQGVMKARLVHLIAQGAGAKGEMDLDSLGSPAKLANALAGGIPNLDFDRLKPHLDEIVRATAVRTVGEKTYEMTPKNMNIHIDDSSTVLRLYWEALKLNFFYAYKGDAPSIFRTGPDTGGNASGQA
jgi:hypothetical protein